MRVTSGDIIGSLTEKAKLIPERAFLAGKAAIVTRWSYASDLVRHFGFPVVSFRPTLRRLLGLSLKLVRHDAPLDAARLSRVNRPTPPLLTRVPTAPRGGASAEVDVFATTGLATTALTSDNNLLLASLQNEALFMTPEQMLIEMAFIQGTWMVSVDWTGAGSGDDDDISFAVRTDEHSLGAITHTFIGE